MITPEADALLLQYPWPGNVRELQNSVMQAVILCMGGDLGASDLRLADTGGRREPAITSPLGVAPAQGYSRSSGLASDGGESPEEEPLPDLLESLREVLARQLAAIDKAEPRRPVPFGKWLTEDLIVEARAAAGGPRRAAALLGIPETTVRRKLRQAEDRLALGMSARSPSWQEVRAVLSRIVRSHVADGSDLPAHAEGVLLRAIEASGSQDIKFRAAVLGVTEPTYQRRLARLEGG